MSRLQAEKLVTTQVTDRDVWVLKTLLKAPNEERYAYNIHSKVVEKTKDFIEPITLSGVSQILKKYHQLGVITISDVPAPNVKGPAKYLITVDYPWVIKMLISQRCLEQVRLLHGINCAFAEKEIDNTAIGQYNTQAVRAFIKE